MQSTKCCLLQLCEMSLDTHRLNSYENRNTKACPALIVACQGYSCHLLLISSASVRSLPFLSFIMLSLAWDVPLISQGFLKISLFFPILLFSSNSLHCTFKKAVQSLQNQRSSELNLPIPIVLSSLIPKMSVFTLANLLLDHIQFTLIHGPNIQGSIVILFFTGSDFIFTTRHIHNWKSFPLWPSLFILSGAFSPVFPSSILNTFQTGWELGGGAHRPVSYLFAFSYCSWGKNTGVIRHSLLQWITLSDHISSREYHMQGGAQ